MKGGQITVNFVTAGATAPLSVSTADLTVSPPYKAGDRVELHLVGRGTANITVSALGCNVTAGATGQSLQQREVISLVKTDTINLNGFIEMPPEIKWLAQKGDYGRAVFMPPSKVVLLNRIDLAIVEVNSVSSYDQYFVSGFNGELAVVLFEADDGRFCSIDLDIDKPSSERKDVSLKIVDFSTELGVPQAYVAITGPFGYNWHGYSDASGFVTLNSLCSGDYTIKVTATGFQISDNDILANDRFTV